MKSYPVTSVVLAALLGVLLSAGCSGGPDDPGRGIQIDENIAKLKSPNPDDRIDGAANLSMAGPRAQAAVPDLIPLLKDQNAQVRSLAAHALGQIGEAARPAVPQLEELLGDRDPNVHSSALNALLEIDPSRAPELEKLQRPNVPMPGR
jgi:HEAT repeat protein